MNFNSGRPFKSLDSGLQNLQSQDPDGIRLGYRLAVHVCRKSWRFSQRMKIARSPRTNIRVHVSLCETTTTLFHNLLIEYLLLLVNRCCKMIPGQVMTDGYCRSFLHAIRHALIMPVGGSAGSTEPPQTDFMIIVISKKPWLT